MKISFLNLKNCLHYKKITSYILKIVRAIKKLSLILLKSFVYKKNHESVQASVPNFKNVNAVGRKKNPYATVNVSSQ